MGISGSADIDSAVTEMRRLVATTIVKRGARGALVIRGNRIVEAGICGHASGHDRCGRKLQCRFCVQVPLQGGPMDECIARGSACGALATQALGSTSGFPNPEEMQRFPSERGLELDRIRKPFEGDGGEK